MVGEHRDNQQTARKIRSVPCPAGDPQTGWAPLTAHSLLRLQVTMHDFELVAVLDSTDYLLEEAPRLVLWHLELSVRAKW